MEELAGTDGRGEERPGAEGSTHARLLAAAAAVYARYGAAGATTRRIAAEAQVNEVTLFRHFGSKEALLEEAVHAVVRASAPGWTEFGLPAVPVDPRAELTAWCEQQRERLREAGAVLQHCFAEQREAGPSGRAWEVLLQMRVALTHYGEALAAAGFIPAAGAPHAEAAMSMLVSVLATDALARDSMPGLLPATEGAPRAYAEACLALLGVHDEPVTDEWEGEGWWSVVPTGDARFPMGPRRPTVADRPYIVQYICTNLSPETK